MQEFLAQFADEIVRLQKPTWRDVVMTNQARSQSDWRHAQNFVMRQHRLLTAEERALLEDWEFVLCDMFTLETVAFLPRLQRCLERVDVLLTEREDAMKKNRGQEFAACFGQSSHATISNVYIFQGIVLNGIATDFQQSNVQPCPCGKQSCVKAMQKT